MDAEGVDGQDETWVTPTEGLPADDLSNHVAGVEFVLRNGNKVFGWVGSASLSDPPLAEQLNIYAFFRGPDRFHLHRYFDSGFETHGPAELSAFLAVPEDEIFPVTYDLSGLATGARECILGKISRDVPRLDRNARHELYLDSLRRNRPR